MRALPAAFVLSMVAHGGAVAWVAHDEREREVALWLPSPPPRQADAPGGSREEADPVLDIQLVDAAAIAGLPPEPVAAPAEAAAAADGRARIATPRSGGSGEPGAGEEATPPAAAPEGRGPRSPLMTMRRPNLLDLPQELVDDFLARSRPVEIPDLPGARIEAEIADIRARMRSRRESYDPTLDRLRLIELYDERRALELQPRRDGTYVADKPAFVADVAPDGSVRLRDKPPRDATDAAMRELGIDPYASEKLRLLDRTRDQRFALGREHRRAQLAQAEALMQRNLDRVWAAIPDVAGRKQAVFELWDDCAETGDAELVAGGAAARVLLIELVRIKLRGADAFTRDELARLNARRTSKATFDPDDPSQGRGGAPAE